MLIFCIKILICTNMSTCMQNHVCMYAIFLVSLIAGSPVNLVQNRFVQKIFECYNYGVVITLSMHTQTLYLEVYVYTSTNTFVHTHTHMYMYTLIYIQMCVHVYTYRYAFCVCIPPYTHISICSTKSVLQSI